MSQEEIKEAEVNLKLLEAKVDLSQSFLNEHDEIRKIFNHEKKSIIYEINPLVPDNIISELKSILETSSSNDLLAINPIIIALAELQTLKNIKYDKEQISKSIENFKAAKKTIISFGKGITEAKKVLKEPHLAYNKKIDSIYNLFDTEKNTVKNCLEENFNEYIEEEEKKKKEAEEKKKQAELQKIKELSEQNEQLIEQSKKAENNKIYLQYESSINKILTDTSVNILNLNSEGLSKLKEKFSLLSFEKVLKEEHKKILNEEQIKSLSESFESSINAALNLISDKIKSLQNAEDLKNVQAENKILEAQTPKSLDSSENNPEIKPQEIPQVPQNIEQPPKGNNDVEKFDSLVEDIKNFEIAVNNLTLKLKSYDFENRNISEIRNILTDKSIPKIQEWSNKLVDWTVQKQNIIKQIK